MYGGCMDNDTNVPNDDASQQDASNGQPIVRNEEEDNPTPEQQPVDSAEYPVVEENVAPQTSILPLKPKKKHLLFIVIVALLIVLGVAFFVWKDKIIGIFVKQPVASQTTQSSSAVASTETKITDPLLVKFITPTTGEVWYATPKAMAPQGWFKGELASSYKAENGQTVAQQMATNAPTYTEVGTRNGSTIVLVADPASGGPSSAYWLLEKRTDGTVALIVQPQSTGTYDGSNLQWAKDAVGPKVTVFDQSVHYDSLSLPATISLNAKESVTRSQYASLQNWFASEQAGTTKTLVKELGSSKLYKSEIKYADTQLTNIGYYVAFPIGTKVNVDYAPNTTSLDKYTFTNGASMQYKNGDGAMVYDEITAIARGCGGASAAVTRSDVLKESELTQVGTTDASRPVYEITNKSNALYTKAYGEYKDSYTTDAISFNEYVNRHGLMVIKNDAGELLVYVRGQYGIGGGCAKPVVYLYPTQTTAVSVRVGADVKVSDPIYPTDGWSNVIAQPSGQLSYNGKTYDSLFWEGTGYGAYPGIVSGAVVKHAEAASTMKRQLAEQGLNAKETTDFMAFWESKIPNKPYIRLTWLNTAQMNALAPLSVSPKPDTLLRVFLDMDGYDTPISLPIQKLTSTARHGFTVVEWGGLTSEIRH